MAHFESTNSPLAVNHQGQYPSVTLSFNLAPGVSLGDATQLIDDAERNMGFPATIRASFQEQRLRSRTRSPANRF
jgi:multidrug efflux pump subunit AcrB